MKSSTPKILHTLGGRSMVGHALDTAHALEPDRLVVVVRHQRDRVASHVLDHAPDVSIVDQDEIPGTGRAVQVGLEAMDDLTEGTVLVTYGDVPLLTPELLTELIERHESEGNAATVLTATIDDPTGYGRIVRDENGDVAGIVEHKDATDEQRLINEVNLSLIHISEPTRLSLVSRMPSSA